jgi:hypothetical protein
MMTRILQSVIFGVVLSATVCQLLHAAHSFPDYPVRPADRYAVKAERNGVVVGAEAVEDPNDQQTYFNTKLRQKGFLPVFVVLSNNSTESFILEKQNIGFGGVSDAAAANAGTAFGSDVLQNILKKTLQSSTLSPGTSVHGFLYVPVPKNRGREKIHIQVPITHAGTHETFILNLYL